MKLRRLKNFSRFAESVAMIVAEDHRARVIEAMDRALYDRQCVWARAGNIGPARQRPCYRGMGT